MEKIDIYRPSFEKTDRTIYRGGPIPKDGKYMVVFICVFDSKGNMLIQKRHPDKVWGNKWDVTAGGAVSSGETSELAAVRELQEELGISIQKEQMTKLMSLYYPKGIHDIYSVICDVDMESLVLQEAEVVDARWASLEEIQEMIETGEFIPVYKEFLQLLFAMKTRVGILMP